MITQPKKWPGVVIGLVIAWIVIKNPEGAAAFTRTVFDAINAFTAAF